MPSCCVVPLCSSRDAEHRFPKNQNLRKKWIVAIKRDKYEPSSFSRICKKHFLQSDYVLPLDSVRKNPVPILRNGAVPSQFNWTKVRSNTDIERSERAKKRLNSKASCVTKTENVTSSEEKHTVVHSGTSYEISDEIKCEIIVENPTKEIGVQCGNNITEKCDASTTTCKDNSGAFRIESFRCISTQSELNFYTGFDNYEHFWLVFSLLGPAVNNLSYYPPSSKPKQLRNECAAPKMTPADEFFLTVMKLRRNMLNKELAFRFHISESRVTRIFITWINFVYCQLKELNIWVPHETADKNLKMKGKTCSSTIIIDCTEIKIEKPTNPVAQQLTYSTYKSCNTLKVLVGISCTGTVTFVSDAYGGSISDRILFEKCGLVNLLEKNNIVLADKGFQIQDLLAYKDVVVNIPEFLKKQSGQLESSQLNKSKKTSSQRIHIERVIGMAKTYKILKGTLTSNLVPLASRIIFMCFMLVNLRSNIMESP